MIPSLWPRRCPIAVALCVALILGVTAFAGDAHAAGGSVPRFASLRASEVNLRTGPGVRYPVEWVFVRRGLPIEITAEFDTWRKIRDWQGTEGWVHQSMLSVRRAAIILNDVRDLRRKPTADSPTIARLQPNVVGKLRKCDAAWCQIEVSGYRGWLRRDEFWGAYSNERID